MSNNAASALRMLDWRIADFKAKNAVIAPSAEIPHVWTIKAHIDHLDPVDSQLHAVVSVRFTFKAEQDKRAIQFSGTATSYFVMDTEKVKVDDPAAFFDKLLHASAMTNMFGNLRLFLLQIGTLFQTGSKQLILPFINLNEFEFDKEYSYTV